MSKKLLDNTSDQPSKFWTEKWVEINDDTRGMYHANSQIKFKTTMLRSSLCNYNDSYKQIIFFDYCAPFTDYAGEINKTQVDNAKDLVVLTPMYSLIEYSNKYSKHLEIFSNITEMNQILLLNI